MEVDCLQDLLRGVELQEEHDEDAMVGDLLEFCCSYVMVYQQHASNDAKDFVQQIDLK